MQFMSLSSFVFLVWFSSSESPCMWESSCIYFYHLPFEKTWALGWKHIAKHFPCI
jgi:hypothetical protein